MERAFVDVPEEFAGSVIEKLSTRKGELQGMGSIGGGFTRLEFVIPSRGLIGYRGEFMTDTKETVFSTPYLKTTVRTKVISLIASKDLSSPLNPVKPLLMDYSTHRIVVLCSLARVKKYMPEWSLGKMVKQRILS